MRNFYHSTPKPKLNWFGGNLRHLAVHVRRGDVTPSLPQRWASDAQVKSCITHALHHMGGGPGSVKVHIFSEGTPDDFAAMRRITVHGVDIEPTFHLNTDLLASFHHMVMADGFTRGVELVAPLRAGQQQAERRRLDGAVGRRHDRRRRRRHGPVTGEGVI